MVDEKFSYKIIILIWWWWCVCFELVFMHFSANTNVLPTCISYSHEYIYLNSVIMLNIAVYHSAWITVINKKNIRCIGVKSMAHTWIHHYRFFVEISNELCSHGLVRAQTEQRKVLLNSHPCHRNNNSPVIIMITIIIIMRIMPNVPEYAIIHFII